MRINFQLSIFNFQFVCMRYTGPRNRIARREGIDLGLKTHGSKSHARLLKKLGVLPGQHGVSKRRKTSDHGLQLREKQKLRYTYGISEAQLQNYFKKAIVKKGNTSIYLTQLLESRLDNVVYRLGFAPTRSAARQIVSHGHIKVNNGIVNISSYQVNVDDIISFSNEKMTKVPYIEKALTNKDVLVPEWLEKKGTVGKITAVPSTEEIQKSVNLRLVVEFYSR